MGCHRRQIKDIDNPVAVPVPYNSQHEHPVGRLPAQEARHEAKVDKVDAAVQVGVSRWEEPQKGLALTGYLEEKACVAINDASCRTSQKETRVETWVGNLC